MRDEITVGVERSRDRIIELARDLVRIPSENHPPDGDEREVQDYIARFWTDAGIDCVSFDPDVVDGLTSHPAYCELGRNYAGRPVVVARVAGSGGGKSLIFNGHVDTVPVGKGAWSVDPYGGEIIDGRLYGRGAFDMKGGVAAMMMAVRVLHELGVLLRGDLIVQTVPDEEFASSNGSVAAVAAGYTADAAVVTEPTGLNIVTGHRGFRLARVTISGKTGIPVYGGEEMTNPIQHLPAVLAGIEEFRRLRLPVTGEDTVMITKLAANEFADDELLTVPPDCRVEVYWQLTPEDSVAQVDTEFENAISRACESDAFFAAAPPAVSYRLRPMPGSRVDPSAPIVSAVSAAFSEVTGENAGVLTGFPPNDMFVFNRYAGVPAIVFGPRGDGAHAPDEYVLVDDVVTCAKVYAVLAAAWCG